MNSLLLLNILLIFLIVNIISNENNDDVDSNEYNEYNDYINNLVNTNTNTDGPYKTDSNYVRKISSSLYDYLPNTNHESRGHGIIHDMNTNTDTNNNIHPNIISIEILESILDDYESNNVNNDNDVNINMKTNTNTNTKQLVLSKVLLGDSGAFILASRLKYSNVYDDVEQLHLSYTHLSDKGVTMITDAIKGYSNLKILHLEGNLFSYEGSLALASCIITLKNLNYVGISNNKISREGAHVLFKAQRIHDSNSNSNSNLEINHPLIHELEVIYHYKINSYNDVTKVTNIHTSDNIVEVYHYSDNNDNYNANSEIDIDGNMISITDSTNSNTNSASISTIIDNNDINPFDSHYTFDNDDEVKLLKLSLLLSSCELDIDTNKLTQYLYSNGLTDIVILANINKDTYSIIIVNNNMTFLQGNMLIRCICHLYHYESKFYKSLAEQEIEHYKLKYGEEYSNPSNPYDYNPNICSDDSTHFNEYDY